MSLLNRKNPVRNRASPETLNFAHAWSRGIQVAEGSWEDAVAESHFAFRLAAADLSKTGWSWRCVSAIDANGETIWIADAHRDDGKRYVVRADEKLTAFLELESATRVCSELA
jgi:hypothetical protein